MEPQQQPQQVIVQQQPPREEGIDKVDNRLELVKYTGQVQSRIRNEITSDFILAKLSDKDKEAIVEMTTTAYLAKKAGVLAKERATRNKWNTDGTCKKVHLNYDENKYMDKINDRIFDSFMIRIYMTAIVNRNVDRNYIMGIISGIDKKEETEEIEENGDRGFLKKLKSKLGRQPEGEHEQ